MEETVRASGGKARTLTVGGISHKGAAVLALVLTIIPSLMTAWVANYEPLVVDTTAISVQPHDDVVDAVDVTSPAGEDFTQYTLAVPDGGTFSFLFWIHNDSPFPVTVRAVGSEQSSFGPNIVDVRMGQAAGTQSVSSTLPFRIPAHAYASLYVRERFTGCLDAGTTTGFGTLPVSFMMFGFVPRETTIVMPMTIRLVGPADAHCTG